MEKQDRRQDRDEHPGQLEEHSLPGTNQAGKGPDSTDSEEPDGTPERGREPQDDHQDDQLEEHSLPGTNQAGKSMKPE